MMLLIGQRDGLEIALVKMGWAEESTGHTELNKSYTRDKYF